MPTELRLPQLAETAASAKLAVWLKQEGEAVAAGEPVVEVETDKTNVEIEAPASGEWTRGPDLPLKLSWAAAADADGRLLIAGGAFWDDRVKDVLNTDRVFLMRAR